MDKFKWELLIECFFLGVCTASFVWLLFCDINVHRKNNWAHYCPKKLPHRFS